MKQAITPPSRDLYDKRLWKLSHFCHTTQNERMYDNPLDDNSLHDFPTIL